MKSPLDLHTDMDDYSSICFYPYQRGSVFDIDFTWRVCTAGYRIGSATAVLGDQRTAANTLLGPPPDEMIIVPAGKQYREIAPLQNNVLFQALRNIDIRDHMAIRDFANTNGLLGVQRKRKPAEAPWELLQDWVREISLMAMIGRNARMPVSYDLSKVAAFNPFLNLEGVLTTDGTNAKFLLRPATLRDAMRLQFAQKIIGGATVLECATCGTWFEAGGRERKRADAKFCSTRCRAAHHNKRRAQGGDK